MQTQTVSQELQPRRTPADVPYPLDQRVELRIKIKSLMLEAREIRKQERRHEKRARACRQRMEEFEKTLPSGWQLSQEPEIKQARAVSIGLLQHQWYHSGKVGALSSHRRVTVRSEARHSQLALAFLRGRPYAKCEKPKTGNDPSAVAVQRIVARFIHGRPCPSAEVMMNWMRGEEGQCPPPS